MNGFGGAGAFSDGKYNITNEFGGTLYEYIGKNKATELMEYVDEINMPTVARAHAYTLLQIPALNVSVCRTTFTFLRHLSVISEQTKTMKFSVTFIIC